MTTLNIGGKMVQVDDGFLQLPPEEQQLTVEHISKQLHGEEPPVAVATPEDTSSRPAGVSFLRGIPIAGAYADKAAAALNAAAQPLIETGLSNAPSFSQRYAENLPRITAQADKFGKEHPIESTVDELLGGTAATAPLAASSIVARALGLSGSLPSMVARGAMSNAAIGAADAAARGQDIARGAEIGGVTGAAFPVAGRLVGRGIQALRRGEPVRPNPTANVNGVEVPQWASQQGGGNAAGSIEQASLAGAMGEDAQRVAQQAQELRNQRMQEASQSFGEQLSPATDPRLGGPGGMPAPHEAGGQVITELAQRHNDQVQTDALRNIAGEIQQFQGRNALVPGQPPQLAREAADQTMEAVRNAATSAATARTAAYQQAGNIPGEFAPSGFTNITRSIQQRLNAGPPETRIRINDMTPNAREALNIIESEIGSGRTPTNLAERGTMRIGPDGRPQMPPITGRDVEAVRQQLVPLVADARNAARAPGGSGADYRAMQGVMDAFNQHVRELARNGGFSGDGQALLQAYDAARAAHSAFRGNFSSRGAGDVVGPVMETVIGKHPGQTMAPEDFAKALFGSENGTGGGRQMNLMQRMVNIFGRDSEAHNRIKQGLLSHILDAPGTEALTPGEQAARIRQLVNGKGNSLAQATFSPEERQRLLDHAALLDRLVPNSRKPDAIDRLMLRFAGADGALPATSRDVIEAIVSPATGVPNHYAPEILRRMKGVLSPESWDSLRQMAYRTITERPEGVAEFGPQALSTRLSKFLDDPAASVLFNDRERQMMRIMQQQYQSMIPLPNTTNPSGSGVLAAKMLNAAKSNLLPMLGLATHGVAGVLTGHAANKALSFTANRRNVHRAMDVFHGKPVAPSGHRPNVERAAAILAKAALPIENGGQ